MGRINVKGWDPSKWEVGIGGWAPKSTLLKFIVGSLAGLLAIIITVSVLGGVVVPVVGIALLIALGAVMLALGVAFAAVLLPAVILLAPIGLIIWLIIR